MLKAPRWSGIEFSRIPVSGSYACIYMSLSPHAIVYVNGVLAGMLEARIRKALRYYDFIFRDCRTALRGNFKPGA